MQFITNSMIVTNILSLRVQKSGLIATFHTLMLYIGHISHSDEHVEDDSQGNVHFLI